MPDRDFLIALYSFLPFGPARTKLLISYFGSAKNAWNASEKDLLEINMNKNIISEFLVFREKFNFKEYFSKLENLKIEAVTVNDKNYPENLKDLEDKPLVLFVRGKLKLADSNSVAIVGSRKMTTYGREVTEKFSSELANLGITIISGLAFGVDFASHKAALSAGGRCIAVLAGGVDTITPRSNEWLGLKIIESRGAIISEFPPGVVPQKYFFPFRNRIISGLSKAVIVTEGAIKSGTIHTVKHALEQGRQVFAVPGQITSPMSQAPLYLIKNGAKMLTETNDILEELDLQLKVDKDAVEKVMPTDENEAKLLELLENEKLHIDELTRKSKLPMNLVSSKLTIMELKGIVKSVGDGIYKII